MFSIKPKSRWSTSEYDVFNFIKLAGCIWLRYFIIIKYVMFQIISTLAILKVVLIIQHTMEHLILLYTPPWKHATWWFLFRVCSINCWSMRVFTRFEVCDDQLFFIFWQRYAAFVLTLVLQWLIQRVV